MEKICQSCGMPLKDEKELGTNKDGSLNDEYCIYCYKDGEFTINETMEEMIERCVKFMPKEQFPTEESAREMLQQYMPKLKRWKK